MNAPTESQVEVWVKSIARAEAREMVSQASRGMAAATADAVKQRLKAQAQRITELERQVEAMKQRQILPVEEWPLRVVNGG
ncbi:hypothetical protein GCM10022276_03060 [Sphingomonas limnosediminicola]|uniref:PH domain-containing protein n=1 Tax=Sphingomonas limnosediminicola TaxID=940133 RepID=A0ABP7KT95_9SPHN